MNPRNWLIPSLVLAVALGGCASPALVAVDPALFARASVDAENQTVGRVALLVPPQVAGTLYQAEWLGGGVAADMRLPIGQIVEQAALAAIGDGLRGGVQRVVAAPPANDGFSGTLVIDAVRFEYSVRVLWLLPVPVLGMIGETESGARLSFDVTLLDTQGRNVWTRTFDTNREVWKRPQNGRESPKEGVVRLAHEAAWRLSQQAVRDLREWVDAERMRPRSL